MHVSLPAVPSMRDWRLFLRLHCQIINMIITIMETTPTTVPMTVNVSTGSRSSRATGTVVGSSAALGVVAVVVVVDLQPNCSHSELLEPYVVHGSTQSLKNSSLIWQGGHTNILSVH